MATAEEERAKKAKYMREWTRKNKDRLNAENRAKRAALSTEELETERARHNEVCKKHRAGNRDTINAKNKAKNWYYAPEAGKLNREKYRDAHLGRNNLRSIKARAKKAGLVYEITEEWYVERWVGGCAATGLPFDVAGSDTPWVAHVDKIIPEKGYTMENCRLVCACYNIAKKHWTDEDVIIMAKALLSKGDR